jgi:hypothetical protein
MGNNLETDIVAQASESVYVIGISYAVASAHMDQKFWRHPLSRAGSVSSRGQATLCHVSYDDQSKVAKLHMKLVANKDVDLRRSR